MKLVTFEFGDAKHLGILEEEVVVDLTANDPGLDDMVELIASGERMTARIAAASSGAPRYQRDELHLLAPIPRPRKNVIAVGRNYLEHAREFSESGFDASEKQSIPDHPIIFTKAPTSVIGPDDPIVSANDPSDTTDYEGELGVVIGRGGARLQRAEAMDHVFGYTIINDVTARDLQQRHVQWYIGKSPDTYCPMGPCLVTADEIPDIGSARIRTHVNGQLRQDARIDQLIFDIATLITVLSSVATLEPGDVIATGTPPGVGIGFQPPRFLAPGDLVEVEIEGIGSLHNPVV